MSRVHPIHDRGPPLSVFCPLCGNHTSTIAERVDYVGEPATRLDRREEDEKRNRAAPAVLLVSTGVDVSWFASTSHIGGST